MGSAISGAGEVTHVWPLQEALLAVFVTFSDVLGKKFSFIPCDSRIDDVGARGHVLRENRVWKFSCHMAGLSPQ